MRENIKPQSAKTKKVIAVPIVLISEGKYKPIKKLETQETSVIVPRPIPRKRKGNNSDIKIQITKELQPC